MPDDHSESVPPLPIPNRTVKRLHADDSADSRVKVGNRQAPLQHQKPHPEKVGFLRLRTPETQYKILCRRDRKGALDSRSQPPRDNAPPCREARRENEAIRQAMYFITNGPPLRYPRYCLAQMRQFLSQKSAENQHQCAAASPSPMLAVLAGTPPSTASIWPISASNASSRAITFGRCARKNSTHVRVFASMNLRDGYSA